MSKFSWIRFFIVLGTFLFVALIPFLYICIYRWAVREDAQSFLLILIVFIVLCIAILEGTQ